MREHMSSILRKLENEEQVLFEDLFLKDEQPIQKLVVCFLAILELSKEMMIKIFQQGNNSKIYLTKI